MVAILTQSVKIKIGDQVLTAELNDSAAAKDLLRHLPLTLDLDNVSGYQEKVAELAAPYDTAGMDYAEDLQAGDLAYWKPKEAPNQRLVFYAGPAGHWDGIFVVGHITTGDYKQVLIPEQKGLTAQITLA